MGNFQSNYFVWILVILVKGKVAVKLELVKRKLSQRAYGDFKCPFLISIPSSANVKRKQVSRVCLSLGSLKFNIDGAASGQPGPAGIGGILRDCNANIKMRFSKSIGIADSSLAEVLAVKEAFLLFSSSQWSSSHTL
ncbi:hypothetical protein PTKIN_Ptkin01aG0352500 [Pterospermum kingtungense]